MSARVIDGKAVAQEVRSEVRAEIEQWIADGGQRPGLATILVGEDPASAVYVSGKQRACVEVGIEGFAHDLPADATQAEVEALIRELNDDPRVSGILLQLPTPEQIDGSYLTTLIDASKDVDGLTPISAGLLAKGLPGLRPCTPAGVMELLRRNDVELTGAEAVVVGRSDLVGKPVAALLLAQHATVTICHSRTRNLGEVCRRADVLVAAVGRPEMVKGSWVKPGAAVIDVGINRTDAGPRRRRRVRARGRGRRTDHARAGRRRADDDRDAAAQHPARREGSGGVGAAAAPGVRAASARDGTGSRIAARASGA